MQSLEAIFTNAVDVIPREELARRLSRQLDIPWATDRLIRRAAGRHQLGAGRRERRRNARGAFACCGELPPHVAVIDDVITTGATVDEVGRVLKRAGVETVEIWAVARTPLAE